MFSKLKLVGAWRAIRAAVESGSVESMVKAVVDAGELVGLTPNDAAMLPAIDAAKRGDVLMAAELATELVMAGVLHWFAPTRMASMPGADEFEMMLMQLEAPIPMSDATPPEPMDLSPGEIMLLVRAGIALVKWIRERRAK